MSNSDNPQTKLEEMNNTLLGIDRQITSITASMLEHIAHLPEYRAYEAKRLHIRRRGESRLSQAEEIKRQADAGTALFAFEDALSKILPHAFDAYKGEDIIEAVHEHIEKVYNAEKALGAIEPDHVVTGYNISYPPGEAMPVPDAAAQEARTMLDVLDDQVHALGKREQEIIMGMPALIMKLPEYETYRDRRFNKLRYDELPDGSKNDSTRQDQKDAENIADFRRILSDIIPHVFETRNELDMLKIVEARLAEDFRARRELASVEPTHIIKVYDTNRFPRSPSH